MYKVLINRLGGLSPSMISVVRLTDRPDMTIAVYLGHKTTTTTFIGNSNKNGEDGLMNAFFKFFFLAIEIRKGKLENV